MGTLWRRMSMQTAATEAQHSPLNFVDVSTWVLMCLATMGVAGRSEYNISLTKLFGDPELPNAVKVGWNEEVLKLTTG